MFSGPEKFVTSAWRRESPSSSNNGVEQNRSPADGVWTEENGTSFRDDWSLNGRHCSTEHMYRWAE